MIFKGVLIKTLGRFSMIDELKYYEQVRQTLERAGPVYIKWGQWGSSRYDLLPMPLCDEL